MSRPATLLTDFGTRDGYAGALRAVLRQYAPDAQIDDISHDIPPQDTLAAAVTLWTACRHYPPDSLHLVVVDPEVGTDRGGLVVRAWDQWFVAPDNGVLHFPLLAADARAWALDPALREARAATTFDGRDWFAPAAGRLLAGTPADQLGRSLDRPVRLNLPDPVYEPYRWLGHVLHVDRFGNLISDLPAPQPDARSTARVFLGEEPVGGIRKAYAEVLDGHALATVGAWETVEIGVNQGSAVDRFRVRRGSRVEILFPTPQPTPQAPWAPEPPAPADDGATEPEASPPGTPPAGPA